MNFFDIEYLKVGNNRQKLAYKILKETNILAILQEYNPVVVGTIPIAIDIKGSDIDIACFSENLLEFKNVVNLHFSAYDSFSDRLGEIYVASFQYLGLPIEIYGESLPTFQQNGYRHMVIEDRIMQLAGDKFRQEIIRLKQQGYKTEPAFGQLLKLDCPYSYLLELETLTDEALKLFITQAYIIRG